MDQAIHTDLRGYGTAWGSEHNRHRFLPARYESTKGNVSGAEAVTTGSEPQSRVPVKQQKVENQSQALTLEGIGAEIILDYGVSVAGVPFFEITTCDDVELQVFFSESRPYLDNASGDGPISFVAGPATYRNPILRPVAGSNYLVETHGAQRWQKIVLLTPGRVSISSLGFMATVSSTHPTNLPGYFSCSNPDYNALWDASVRTIQLYTFEAGRTPPLWMVTPDGALIQGQRAVKYQSGYRWSNYTLEFDVVVHRKNFGLVVGGTAGHGYTIYIHAAGYLRAGQPESERFQGPSYSVVWGYVDEDAVSVENTYLQSGLLPFELDLGVKLRISTVLDASGITLTINGDIALRLSSDLFQKPAFGPSEPAPVGTIGLGPGPDGLATFGNVRVTSNIEGSVLYESTLNRESDLDEYFTGTVKVPCLLDGGKRDRLVWGGDAAIMGSSVAYSTNELESLKGTIDILLSVSKADGAFAAFCPPDMPPGPGKIGERADGRGHHFSAAYELYMIQTISDAVLFGAMSKEELRAVWPLIVKQLDRILGFVDENNLIFLPEKDVLLAMDFNYYDPPRLGYSTKLNCQFVLSLKQAIRLGDYVEEDTATYGDWVVKITTAINVRLWNARLGVYGITAASMDVVAQDANVFAILSGVADAGDRTDLVFDTLAQELKHPLGLLLAFNRASGYRESLSTFISGWHLEAAFQKGRMDHANLILDKVLCPLTNTQHPHYSGSMWELVFSNGEPGMGAYTSMAHSWAAVAASALPRYVVGLQSAGPGWSKVRIAPQPFGLQQAEAYVETPLGRVRVAWTDSEHEFGLAVEIPEGLDYEIVMPYAGVCEHRRPRGGTQENCCQVDLCIVVIFDTKGFVLLK